MTTIATKDGILAADSLVTSGNRLCGTTGKVYRLADNALYAAAGTLEDQVAAMDWLNDMNTEKPKLDDSFIALVVTENSVVQFGAKLFRMNIDAPFHAEGSGADLAIGVMAQGGSAVDAVRVACKYDTGSDLPVQWHHVTATAQEKGPPERAKASGA